MFLYHLIKRRKQGFTLVEILIVVAIIGILAVIAIPNFLRSKMQSNDAAAQGTLKTVANALETYYANNNLYPNAVTTLLSATPAYLNSNYFVGTYSGFTFTYSASDYSYLIVATPVSVGVTGSRSFTISTGGLLQ